MAKVTGAELAQLWKAGAVQLPYAAVQYANAAGSVHETGLMEGGAFAGRAGAFHEAWTRLRDTVQDHILAVSRDNLVKAGDALVHIANAYADADTANARAVLDAEITETLNGPEYERPVGHVPEAPRHDDPQPKDHP